MEIKKFLLKRERVSLLVYLIIILAFFYFLFGFIGLRFFIGLLIMWLPSFLILNIFNIKKSEKYVFSLLLAFTLFPSIVFLLGFLVPFKFSIIAVFIIGIVTYYALKKYMKK